MERDVIMLYSFTVSLNVLKVYPANINLLVRLIQKGCYVTDYKYFIKPQVLGAVSRSPGNLPGPVSIFLNVFSPTRTMITDMVLGQCFYRIVRF